MNENKVELTIKPQWFSHLPSLVGSQPSALFPCFDVNQLTKTSAVAEMKQAGILDAAGKIKIDYLKPIQTLVQSCSCTRLKMLCEDDLVEFQVFWSVGSSEPVALNRSEEGFILYFPAPVDSMLNLLAEFTGVGSYDLIPAVGEFDFTHALVLAAFHDLTRRHMFLYLGGAVESEEPKISIEQINQQINHQSLSSSNLVWVLKSAFPQPVEPDLNQIQQALDQLEKAGLILKMPQGYVPEAELMLLCRRMLHFSSLVKAEAMAVNGDGIDAACFVSIQCGIRDLLMLEFTDNKVSMRGLSARNLLQILNKFLTDPKVAVVSSPDQGKGELCACGKQLAADARFCKFCGKPRPAAEAEEAPRFCSSCGNALKSGKSFCVKCGNKMA